MLKPRDRYADAVEAEMEAGWSWRVAKDHVKRAMDAGSYNSLWGIVERLCKISFTRGRDDVLRARAARIEQLEREVAMLSSGGALVAEAALTKEVRLRRAAQRACEALLDVQSRRRHPLGDPDEGLAMMAAEAARLARAVLAERAS